MPNLNLWLQLITPSPIQPPLNPLPSQALIFPSPKKNQAPKFPEPDSKISKIPYPLTRNFYGLTLNNLQILIHSSLFKNALSVSSLENPLFI